MQRALRLIRRDPEITRCYWDKWDSTWYGELGATKAILNAGYNIDCLIHRYFNFNSHFVISFSQPRRTSPCVRHWWMVVSNLLQDFPSDWKILEPYVYVRPCLYTALYFHRIDWDLYSNSTRPAVQSSLETEVYTPGAPTWLHCIGIEADFILGSGHWIFLHMDLAADFKA